MAIHSLAKLGLIKASQIKNFKNIAIKITEHDKLAQYFKANYEIFERERYHKQKRGSF